MLPLSADGKVDFPEKAQTYSLVGTLLCNTDLTHPKYSGNIGLLFSSQRKEASYGFNKQDD